MCVQDLVGNHRKFKNVGYWSEWHYFAGLGKYDDKKIGWNGHTENGSTLGSVKEILSNVSIDWNNILLAINVHTKDGMHVLGRKDFKWSRADYRGCQLINLNQYFDMSEIVPTSIFLKFSKQENYLVSLKIQDSKKQTLRALHSNHFNFIGPPIQINDVISPSFTYAITYALKISNFVNLEDDLGSKCVNYPNKDFKSYQDCDADFVHKKILRTYNITPFWAAKSDAEVTKSK